MAVMDHREEWAEAMAKKGQEGHDPDERTWGRRQVYYARGAGSVGIGKEGPPSLVCCDNPDAYSKLMALPAEEVERIAEAHGYGQRAWPSGEQVPQRGANAVKRDPDQFATMTSSKRYTAKVKDKVDAASRTAEKKHDNTERLKRLDDTNDPDHSKRARLATAVRAGMSVSA